MIGESMDTLYGVRTDGSPDYYDGVRHGLKAYAVWKDGEQFVGSCGTKLTDALRAVDRMQYKHVSKNEHAKN